MAIESSGYVTNQDDLSQSRTNSSYAHDSEKAKLAQIPKVTEPEFRIACNEIAESLSKNWRFKFHVIGMIVVTVTIIIGLIASLFGWTIKGQFHNTQTKLDRLMETEVYEAKVKVDKFIEAEFQKENIKKTIQQVANDQSAKLIQNLIQPSVINSEKRIEDFNQYLVDQKKTIDKDMSTLQQEVTKLQERNNITALADKAIAKGDLHAFQKLKILADFPDNDAAMSELLRIYNAYSFSAPNRWGKVTLPASLITNINPYAKSDEELTAWELLPVLKRNEPALRARTAILLAQKDNLDSYAVAKAIIDAIKKEDNLEVIRWLNGAFSHVTGYSANQLDGSDTREWWQKNESDFAKKNRDKK